MIKSKGSLDVMDVLRIELRQSSANYRKEEAMENKITYPLPPPSTVIGALHSACNFKEYHKMDVSIQGNFESMHKEPYTDYCFLNNIMDDRGILVKFANDNSLSAAYKKVAKADKSQGNSFREGKTITIYDNDLLTQYRNLRDLNDSIKDFNNKRLKKLYEVIKVRKKTLATKKKTLDKKSEQYKRVVDRDAEIKQFEKTVKEKFKAYEEENYKNHINKFYSLTTALKYYEILNNITLVLHIRSDKDTIKTIEEKIYNLKSIGRSEDFVEIMDVKRVTLYQGESKVKSVFSCYANYEDVKNKLIYARQVKGTKYYLNKDYVVNNGKRDFQKKKVMYLSYFSIKKAGGNIYVDNEDNEKYIVNFI